ncbi:M56 family metallopeptidase [Sphingobacterium sp. LRF_L2]|uniref:M56 family metallopeptidase n=1 Tax=Sphingobacterium sp. LRF_L2 TaxID=3369421 RepID=UPI003F5D96F1
MNALFQNITHALGWGIVHSLWQSAALYVLISLFYILKPNLSAKHRYLVATAGQMIIVLLFLGTFLHSLDLSVLTNNPVNIIDIEKDVYVNNHNTPAFFAAIEPMFPIFSSLYVLGLFIQLIFFANSFSKLRYLRTRGLSDAPITWLESFQQACTTLQITENVKLYLSEKISVPLTLGHFKPIILFPLAYANQLDLNQVETILIHELAHIKRYDYLFNLLKIAVETILFFNPFVWLLSKHIEEDREHACDDIVLSLIPSPIAYAQTLLTIETLRNEETRIAMAATGTKHHLFHRIKRITKMEKKHIHTKQHLLAILLSCSALLTIAWIAPSTRSNSTQQENIEHAALIPIQFNSAIDTIEVIQTTSSIRNDVDTVGEKCEETSIQPTAVSVHSIKTAQTDTDEAQDNIQKVERQAKRIEAYYNSPEWKEHIATVEQNAQRIENYYNSSEWKEHIAKIEQNAKRVEDYYNSPEWKKQIAKIEQNAKRIEDYYNITIHLNGKNKLLKLSKTPNALKTITIHLNGKNKLLKLSKTPNALKTITIHLNGKNKLLKLSKTPNALKTITIHLNGKNKLLKLSKTLNR